LAAASPLPDLPKHVRLRDEDWPFWTEILRARARDEWSGPDLVVGAQLARCQRDIEIESQQLDAEGSIMKNDRGTMVMNPRVAVLEQLARREMALMRSLRMGGKDAGDPRGLKNARDMQRSAERVRDELGDELLAT
jgi:hypothetical protein